MRKTAMIFFTGLAMVAGSLLAEDAVDSHSGAAAMCGFWKGEWKSSDNGHHGPLRAEFRSCHGDCCDVVFTGRFCAVVPFRYRLTLQATPQEDGSVKLSGSRSLGLLLGTFHFSGEIRDDQLHAEFSAAEDHGVFELSRSEAPVLRRLLSHD